VVVEVGAGTTRHSVVTVMRLHPARRRPAPGGRADGLVQVRVAAQLYAGLVKVVRRTFRCRRRPLFGEQLLEDEYGGVVGGRDVDDD
jgi:hypothetical protein